MFHDLQKRGKENSAGIRLVISYCTDVLTAHICFKWKSNVEFTTTVYDIDHKLIVSVSQNIYIIIMYIDFKVSASLNGRAV